MAKHALLSASGAKRWLACPPSARLEENFPDTVSDYAAKGTLAHSYAEALIMRMGNLKAIKASPLFDAEMDRVIHEFKDYVMERYALAGKEAYLFAEERLSYAPWVKDGFGTGDVVIIGPDYFEIIDLKYGTGVPVSAEDNPQLRLYALGALNEYGFMFSPEKVIMTIVQPRLSSISSREMSRKELLEWGSSIVKTAELAYAGKGGYKAGEHCRFCRAKALCKARAEENLQLAKYEFKNADLLDEEELGEILERADLLKAWAEDIKKYALSEAQKGTKIPGWKVVAGRSVRKFTDTVQVEKTLRRAGYTDHAIYKPAEMQSLSNIEKTLGKKEFSALLGGLVEKQPGKPTLVPETDERPEWHSAQEDFEILD